MKFFQSSSIRVGGDNVGGVVIINGEVVSGGDSIEGNREIMTVERSVSDFHSIKIAGGIDVIHKADQPNSLKLTADSNIHDLITTNVIDGCLVVASNGSFATQNKLFIECSSKFVNQVSIAGSGDVELLDVNVNSIEFEIKGSGDIEASGTTNHVKAEVKGSGEVDLSELSAKSADFTVKGSGDIRANVTDSLRARVKGSGDIRIKGNPATRDIREQGTGSVRVK